MSLPLHAVQVELVPRPVGRPCRASKKSVPMDRQVEGLVDLRDAEPQRRLHVGDEGVHPLPLSGVPGALARDDLVGGQPPRRADLDVGARLAPALAAGPQDDGQRALREIERERLRAGEVEVARGAADEVLDRGLREGPAGQIEPDRPGGVLREEDEGRQLLRVVRNRERNRAAVGRGGCRSAAIPRRRSRRFRRSRRSTSGAGRGPPSRRRSALRSRGPE